MQKESGYLTNKLLIATHALDNSCFEKSVIYVCAHDKSGAMGILINHVFSDLTCIEVLDQMNVNTTNIQYNPPIHFGGPVNSSKGFILHTNDYTCDNTRSLSKNMSITSTIDILNDMAIGKGPSKSIVALGYAGWNAGQLEEEIHANSWLSAPANENIIFNTENTQKWTESTKLLGVDLSRYSTNVGHA